MSLKRIRTQTEDEILDETENLILKQARLYAEKFKDSAMPLQDCDALERLMATADRVSRMREATNPSIQTRSHSEMSDGASNT